MKRVCVFCGSNPGVEEKFTAAAKELGGILAAHKLTLVYGGGRTGLMGILADAVLERGGEVIGVIPHALEKKELAHRGVTKLHIVNTMHERKALMAELADAFVGLPGGIGTMEEFFEIWTWAQLGMHQKPFGLLNVANYFDPLSIFLEHMVKQRFLLRAHRNMMQVESSPEELVGRFQNYQPPTVEKWITPGIT